MNKLIKVNDDVKVQDQLGVWKMWFNGAKHFFTVKILPPRL